VQSAPCGVSDLGKAGVAGAMDGMGAFDWLWTLVRSLGERAEAGTATAAKMPKIGRILKVCGLAPGRLTNDKREANL
jgi:hypothetical protein